MLKYIGNTIFKNSRNKGIGAGGANTNILGKSFEIKTANEERLLSFGYIKQQFTNKKDDFYLYKEFEDKKIIFIKQTKLKKYIKNKYNIDSFRNPDEAYIIEYKNGKKILKILEKKEQSRDGSIEIKLWAGPSLKREYQLIFDNYFEIQYNFCINEFLYEVFS